MITSANRPTLAQMGRARRLLAQEGALGTADECAAAAGRVYDKLHVHLSPLLGTAGAQALLVRSGKLTRREFSFLEVASLEGFPQMRECLRAQDPRVASDAAATLFGTFFTLLTTFIGERLTTQALRAAWPTIEDAVPTETKE